MKRGGPDGKHKAASVVFLPPGEVNDFSDEGRKISKPPPQKKPSLLIMVWEYSSVLEDSPQMCKVLSSTPRIGRYSPQSLSGIGNGLFAQRLWKEPEELYREAPPHAKGGYWTPLGH